MLLSINDNNKGACSMHKKILYLILLIILSIYVIRTKTHQPQNVAEIDAVFKEENAVGTFVVYDVQESEFIIYNEVRSRHPYYPASTFKIVNSLIGLSTKAVKNTDEVFYKYDGSKMFLKSWEKDANLRDAIKVSQLPAYQELARKIGLEKMQENITNLNYGNMKVSNQIDTFWLQGPLEISAIQQAEFLAKLATLQLPISQSIQQSIHEIIKLEEGQNWTLYGKTGWTGRINARDSIGWFVGWIESNGKVYSFAMNIDAKEFTELEKREVITKKVFKVLRLL